MAAPFSYTQGNHRSPGAPSHRRAERYAPEYSRECSYGEDYPMYHSDPSKSNYCACVDDLQEVQVQTRRSDQANNRISTASHNGARTTHDIVAAYGVYSRGAVEETGFESAQYYPQQVVVVASPRDGTTANTLANTAPAPDSRALTSDPGCCRPALPLVLVALFIIVFLLFSGVLFYFNVVNYTPDSTMQDSKI